MSPNKTLYVRDDDVRTWEQAEQFAKLTHQSVSLVVAEALRRFLPPHVRVLVEPDDPGEIQLGDDGTPMLVYTRHHGHGMGWTLYYLEGPEPTAGIEEHFIPGGRDDTTWAIERAEEYLSRRQRSAGGDLEDVRVGALGELYRLAQARRLLRFCAEHGLDPQKATDTELAPILDASGKVVPEDRDF